MKFLLIIEIGICRTKDDLSIFVIKFYPSVVARLRKASAQLLSRAQLLSPTVHENLKTGCLVVSEIFEIKVKMI